jgi:lipopolysaccharide biosynthesis glycosyltransferase
LEPARTTPPRIPKGKFKLPKKIAIVAATDAGYLPAACCQLASTAAHLSESNNAELHLVVCEVSKAEVDEAANFFRSRNIDATITHPERVVEDINPIGNRWPRAAYLRLYFDAIFGDEYDRLVYFDSDTRVCAPLDPLINADLKGRPVGAVHDFIYYVTGNIRRRRRDLFLPVDAPYLQSGVMVFDWPATLTDGALGRARKFLDDYPERCMEAPDQDALNAALVDKWTPLDPRWNLHELYLMFGGRHKPFIEHYTSTKPWSKRRPKAWRAAADWYKRELAGTRWADFIPPQSAQDRLQAQLAFLNFRYTPRVRDALAQYAPFLLDLAGKPRQRSDDEELPWAPKSRADVEAMTEALIEEAAGTRGLIRPPEIAIGDALP